MPVSVTDLLKTMTLFFQYDPDLIDPPVWYLQIEIRIAIILPFIVYAINRWGGLKLAILLFVVLSVLGKYMPFGTNVLPVYLSEIIARILVKDDGYMWHSIKRMPMYMCIFIIVLGLFFLDVYNIFNYSGTTYIIQAIQAIGAILVISIVYLHRANFMNNTFFVGLGNISYQLYLIHFIVMLMLRPLNLNVVSITVLTLGISIVISILIKKLDTLIQRLLYSRLFYQFEA